MPRAALDDGDEAADAAGAVLLGQADDLGLDRRDELVVEDPARVPGHIAEGAEGEDA